MTFAASAMQNPGEVFTRRWVVEVLLDLTGYTTDRDLGQVSLLEPSCGSGAFLSVVLERLIASAQGHRRDLASLGDAIRAYDLQAGHVEVCRALCRDQLVAAGESVSTASALAERWVQQADFLLADILSGIDDSPADVVIGNPPYIRYDDLADDLVTVYRNTWPTMRGRGDIYIGFIERSLGMLKPGGKARLHLRRPLDAKPVRRATPGTGLRPVRRRARLDDARRRRLRGAGLRVPSDHDPRQPPAGLGSGGGHDGRVQGLQRRRASAGCAGRSVHRVLRHRGDGSPAAALV